MPYAAPRPCSKHPAILVTKSSPCPQCPIHGWQSDKVRGSRHQRGYGAKWDKTRVRILRRDGYLCQPCLNNNRYTTATQVDHIIPKERQGTDEDSNLQSICDRCHKVKTLQDRKN